MFASRQIAFRRANRFNRFRCFGIRVQRRGAVLSIRHRPQKRAAPLFSLFPAMGYGAGAAPDWQNRKICQFCTRRCELASGHMLPHFALSWGHESPMITYRPCPFGKAAGRAWRASLYPPFLVMGVWGGSPMFTHRPCPFGKVAGRARRTALCPPFLVMGYGAGAP